MAMSNEPTPAMNEAQLVRSINVLIAKGDKASDKAQQFYVAAGQHLKTLKENHTTSWKDWERVLKEKCHLSTGRASELMQIADGRKTVAAVRVSKAESVRKLRSRSSLRSEELSLSRDEEPIATAAISAIAPAKVNGTTPAAADQIIEATAEGEHTDNTYVGRDPEWDALCEMSGLQCAWDATSAEAKQQFVAANIVELTTLLAHHRKQQASAAADQAIEQTMPPPLAPIVEDYPTLPGFLDRANKPN
jgi:hypothetical protein